MSVGEKCANPDEPCDREAVEFWKGLKMCSVCIQRFRRHGDGKKLRPWQHYLRKKADREAKR